MILKVPKQAMLKGAKRRRAGTVEHCDYLTNKNYRPAKRRRTDPLITRGSILDKVAFIQVILSQHLEAKSQKFMQNHLSRVQHSTYPLAATILHCMP